MSTLYPKPAIEAIYDDRVIRLHWYGERGHSSAPWTPEADLGKTLTEVTVHFTAEATPPGRSDRTYQTLIGQIAYYHAFQRDWSEQAGKQLGDGIMYHYAIAPTGTIFQTTPESKRTWNAYDANARNLAVVLLAGPDDPKSLPAIRALFQLLNWLCWGRPDLPHVQALPGKGTFGVLGHDESLIRQNRPPKGCPGPYLAVVQEWRSAAKFMRGPVPLP